MYTCIHVGKNSTGKEYIFIVLIWFPPVQLKRDIYLLPDVPLVWRAAAVTITGHGQVEFNCFIASSQRQFMYLSLKFSDRYVPYK